MGTIYQKNSPFSFDWGTATISIVIGMAIAAFGGAISKEKQASESMAMDEKALDIVAHYADGREVNKRFNLYLRPFDMDDCIFVDHAETNMFDFESYNRVTKDTLERIIGLGASQEHTVIAFGGLENPIHGVGAVGIHNYWKKKLVYLIKNAYLMFVVPSVNDGTFWEISRIVDTNRLDSCIFLMPPVSGDFISAEELKIKKSWKLAQEKMSKEFKLNIPNYRSEGCIFSLSFNTEELNTQPFAGTPKKFAKNTNKLLNFM